MSGLLSRIVYRLRSDLASNTADATGAGQLGYSAARTYPAGTIGKRLRQAVSVADVPYSADGTGVADSLAAFSAAAAAVGAGGNVIVPAGTWQLSGIPATAVTWLVDSRATFTGAGSLCTPGNLTTGRIVKLGNGGTYSKGTKIGALAAWLEAVRVNTEANSDLVVLSSIGQTGLLGGSRTVDFATAGSMGCIGVQGWALNNNTVQVQTAYAGYFEARRSINAGSTQGIEIDVVNYGNLVAQTPASPNGAGISEGLRIASGGGEGTATKASAALSIINNGAQFDKGVVFQSTALDVTSGEAAAFALYEKHALHWYSGATLVARIRSDANAPSVGMVFGAATLNFQTMAGANVFTLTTAGALAGLITGFGNYASDALAAAAGVPVGGFYRNGSALQIRAA